MTTRICQECGIGFNGLGKLYDHKLQEHPNWRREISKTLDSQIQALESRERNENV